MILFLSMNPLDSFSLGFPSQSNITPQLGPVYNDTDCLCVVLSVDKSCLERVSVLHRCPLIELSVLLLI
jgi:hypothetical protein